MKCLEIGSRKKLGPEWTLMDIRPGPAVDVVAELGKPLPFPDGSFDLVYLSHVLEHVAWFKTDEVLCELHRILAPGGRVEIWVPDLGKLIEAYVAGQLPDGWLRNNPAANPTLWFLGRLFGVGGYAENWHHAAFDRSHLGQCLSRAGFVGIELLERPRGYDHGWINLGLCGRKAT